MRVLVVDGYEESREASLRELRMTGHDVLGVEEEDEAVHALASESFDVVLLDLPPAEAEEAASSIRKASMKLGRAPSVIALVEPATSRQLRAAGRATGIDYFILRPCPPAEIANHLRRMRRG